MNRAERLAFQPGVPFSLPQSNCLALPRPVLRRVFWLPLCTSFDGIQSALFSTCIPHRSFSTFPTLGLEACHQGLWRNEKTWSGASWVPSAMLMLGPVSSLTRLGLAAAACNFLTAQLLSCEHVMIAGGWAMQLSTDIPLPPTHTPHL